MRLLKALPAATALLFVALAAAGCMTFSDAGFGGDSSTYIVQEGMEDGWAAVAADDGRPDVKPFGDSDGTKARLYFHRRGGRRVEAGASRLEDPSKLFPAEVSEQVSDYVEYFTTRGRKHFERWLSRSPRYLPMMKQTFAEHSLPPDLVYLSMIESGLNPFATSRARAVGLWQFISGTGRRYELRIDRYVDERRDPEKATQAAARYLKDLYEMFGSWDLALASYNAGEGKIVRGVRRYSTENFWEIRKTGFLRDETKNYVPQYLAALIIAKNPAKYGFDDITYERPLRYEVVAVNGSVSLSSVAKVCGVSRDDMRVLNPELRRSVTPPGRQYMLKVPAGTGDRVKTRLAALAVEGRRVASTGDHRVRPGETLSKIARRYGTTAKAVARANNMHTSDVLRVGTTLDIPGSSGRLAARRGGDTIYVVRPGDTLSTISARYRTTVRDLMRRNGLRTSRIAIGKRLVIPVSGDETIEGRSDGEA